MENGTDEATANPLRIDEIERKRERELSGETRMGEI